jgi:hypothetical protein
LFEDAPETAKAAGWARLGAAGRESDGGGHAGSVTQSSSWRFPPGRKAKA